MTHWVHGIGNLLNRSPLVTHCLLIETSAGLLLVDTGLGRQDIQHPTLMVRTFLGVSNYRLAIDYKSIKETAYQQVQQLGYQPEDVRHIAITHMHLDHVGGLPDFPNAKVHIFAKEYAGITHPKSLEERYVCRREHWAHRPKWVIHELDGDSWFGFDCTPQFKFADIAFTFVPLTGHTRGHSAIVIKTQDGWLMHCGDAYVHYGDVDPDEPHHPPRYGLTLNIMGLFSYAFREIGVHSSKLRTLLKEHGDEIQTFCSHDPLEFARFCPDFDYGQFLE